MAKTVQVSESLVRHIADQGWNEIRLAATGVQAIEGVVMAASSFFRLPPAIKDYCRLASSLGYRPYGIEYSRSSDRPDEMETFSVTAASQAHRFDVPEADHLNQVCAVAFEELAQISEALITSLASLVTGRSFEGTLAGGLQQWSTLQINYSRPSLAQSGFINEVHEDGHFLTLAHATTSGLEIRQPNGAFRPINPSSGRVIVMLGELASLMTDGRLHPLFHQVRSSQDYPERISVLFFADLAPELCQPWILGETNRQIDVAGYVRANPARFGLNKQGSN